MGCRLIAQADSESCEDAAHESLRLCDDRDVILASSKI